MSTDYAQTTLPVFDRVADAHNDTLRAFGQPGAWWSGADRLRIVRETRAAPSCQLCQEKARALTANAVQGEHSSSGELPPIAVEAIHGIRNDSGRLTRRWFDDLIDMGLQPEAYVELVGVAASSVIVDTFAQALGTDLPTLPEPAVGTPTFERADDVVDAGAWLPIAAEGRANIVRALGLVPSAVELFFGAFGNSYYMRPDAEFTIGRRQVELIASRVSAVNECFY